MHDLFKHLTQVEVGLRILVELWILDVEVKVRYLSRRCTATQASGNGMEPEKKRMKHIKVHKIQPAMDPRRCPKVTKRLSKRSS